VQAQFGLHGAVGEIGVHHGNFAIVVAHQARVGERVLAADLFGSLQHLNKEHSGRGDLSKLLRNTARFGIRAHALSVHVGSSTSLPLRYPQPLRLFSVDGGHTEALAASDLAWAACNALEGALILLDDYTNPGWPGVKTGAARQHRCGARSLTPFAEVENKLYLTTSSAFAKRYQHALQRHIFFGRRLRLGTRPAEKVHGSSVLRVSAVAGRNTTAAELMRQWHRAVLQAAWDANVSADVTARFGAGPKWDARLDSEAMLARLHLHPWLSPMLDGLLRLMDWAWPTER